MTLEKAKDVLCNALLFLDNLNDDDDTATADIVAYTGFLAVRATCDGSKFTYEWEEEDEKKGD